MLLFLCVSSLLQLGGHYGRDKTLEKISSRFHWPMFTKDVRIMTVLPECQTTNDGKFCNEIAPMYPIKVHSQVYGKW